MCFTPATSTMQRQRKVKVDKKHLMNHTASSSARAPLLPPFMLGFLQRVAGLRGRDGRGTRGSSSTRRCGGRLWTTKKQKSVEFGKHKFTNHRNPHTRTSRGAGGGRARCNSMLWCLRAHQAALCAPRSCVSWLAMHFLRSVLKPKITKT